MIRDEYIECFQTDTIDQIIVIKISIIIIGPRTGSDKYVNVGI
jgi:hypothetical protein